MLRGEYFIICVMLIVGESLTGDLLFAGLFCVSVWGIRGTWWKCVQTQGEHAHPQEPHLLRELQDSCVTVWSQQEADIRV